MKFSFLRSHATTEEQTQVNRTEPEEFTSLTAVQIDCHGVTDIGHLRETNQDHFLISDLRKHLSAQQSSFELESPEVYGEPLGKLLLVADGMGGANAGEVASELAIKATVKFLLNSMHWLLHPSPPEIEKFVLDLKKAACFSHQAVREDAAHKPDRQGMGSTLTVVYLVWPMMYVLHVGDSRCYLWHQGQLGLLTKDQTFAQFLYDQNKLTKEEFVQSQYHHVLMSAIGMDAVPHAAVYRQRLQFGDKLLLCSDGVNLHLGHDEIDGLLRETADSKTICEKVVQRSLELGGKDNATAIVAQFLEPQEGG
jgi:protein phosphatase